MASRKRFQYQVSSNPPTQPLPESSWHQPWSEPVRQKIAPTLAIALMASGLFVTPFVAPSSQATATQSISSEVIFPRSLIYQSKAEPVFVAENITADKWFEPLSEPVRIKSRLSTGLQQSIASVPFVETITEDKWHQRWSEPVRVKNGLRADEQQSFTAPSSIVVPATFPPWSEPVRIKRLPVSLQSSVAAPVTTPEIVTLDKWFSAWRDPAKPKELLRVQYQQAFTSDSALIPNPSKLPEGWIAPFSDPVRAKSGLAPNLQQFSAFTAPIVETITEDKWHQAWSEPVRTKNLSTVIQSQPAIAPFVPEVITADKWFNPFSDPVRFNRLAISQYPYLAFNPIFPVPEDIFEDKWHQTWSEPVRTRNLPVALQQSFTIAPTQPAAVTAQTVISTETSQVIFGQSIIYQSYTAPVFAPPFQWYPMISGDTGVTFQNTIIYQISAEALTPETHVLWYQEWSQPYRIAKLSVALQAPATAMPAVQEIVTEDKWHQPWTEPVRIKAGLSVGLQQSVASVPFIEIVTEDKWHQAWTEPVRVKVGLRPSLQPTLAHSPLFTEIITEDKWHQPWSIPSVLSKKFGANQQQALAQTQTPVEVITEDKWHQPWSEPVRLKIGLRTEQQQFLAYSFSKPIVSFSYYNWLTEPVRLKKGLGSHLQSSFTTDPTVIPTSKIPGWLYPWSEPVRQKPGLATGLQSWIAYSPFFVEPVTYDRWNFAWSEPVRTKQGLGARFQQPLAYSYFVEQVTLDKWVYPWSEPVRQKQGLRPSLQQTTTPETPIEPTLNKLIQWYSPFGEPVRQKIGLNAGLQKFFDTDNKPPPPAGITITLSATETNSDALLFGINVYRVQGPLRVYVSIKEIPRADDAFASIEET